MHTSFLTTTIIRLFHCCEKVFNFGHWKKFNEISLRENKDVYNHYYYWSYYAQAKRFSKDFEIKYSGEYHDLYVQGNTLLLADVFENFQNICLELYEHDPVKFLSASGCFYWYSYLIDGRKRS